MERGSVLLDISPTEIGEKKTKLMHIYQIVRIISNACDQKNLSQIRKLCVNNPPLQRIPALQTVNETTLTKAETRNEFRHNVIDLLLLDSYNDCQDDNNELLFFASAKFELTRLQEILKELKKDFSTYSQNVNQTRYSDSAILFVLKYGNTKNENFFNCINILVEAGVDINIFDIKGKTAIDYVGILHEYNKHDPNVQEALREVARLLLRKGIYKPDNKKTLDFLSQELKIDVEQYEFSTMDQKTQLFYWIIKNKTDEFLGFKDIKKLVDEDNGENTLLQLACKKTDNMLPVVQFLLKNGADPNRTTKLNYLTPLELAGMNNNQKIFEEILKHKKTEIRQKQYNNFVRWRSQSMKVKLFELVLESQKLDPNFTYDKTGNTPLHYAIIFSHKKAIQNLLKLHSSLIVRNKLDFSALDIIDSEDLEKYFDSCLALDNYTPYFSDLNYKMQFRFNCLIDDKSSREVKVVSKVGKHPNLEHLLTHPFIHTFITLKWFKIKIYFWVILFLQAIMFIVLSLLFYRLPKASTEEFSCCIFFAVVNIILKAPIFLYFRIKNKAPVFFALKRAALHGALEILLIVTLIGSFFQNQFRAFVFVEMAISFLLTAGYHPKLSKWSLMLQQVFKTFTVLLIFFSLIIISFSIGFHILFPDDEFFKNFFTSIFRTYIMTTGEFNIEESSSFDHSGFVGYLLFLLFAMSMALVIVNFWTGVAVTDIERIEKNSEINASKNVIIFMLFIDYLYTIKYLSQIRKYIVNPLLFLRINDHGHIFHNPEKCEVNFFVNKGNQFEEKEGFPSKVDDECFTKIRCHYYKLAKVPSETEILTRLEEISKMLTEVKAKCVKNETRSFDSKPRKTMKKEKDK
ncbi:hypothetical protein Zmor_020701 [Zophobas morio]|uniref:Transient receptor potential cation channel protein painless n=1 Tax=Zophobas morio TaxID=2755281 RepID=A0AA38I572_9CUCU|nr:hypothetical protein Zmor_020701 [Zophobas morio]